MIEGKSLAAQLEGDIGNYEFHPTEPINSDMLSTLVAQLDDGVLREILSSKEQLQQQIADLGTHQGMMAEDPLGMLEEVRGGSKKDKW